MALTPLLARAVAAWYALFGTMLVSCAIGLRRPAEAIIPYATLGCWSVLLLLLPLLHPDDVSGAGVYIAGCSRCSRWLGLRAERRRCRSAITESC